MARLSVWLLGPFQVFLDGEPVSGFISDKVRALLAYLVTESNRPHRREYLASLLWPEQEERAARANLRRALANLRQVIDDYDAAPPFLKITPQTLQFNQLSDTWADLFVFNNQLEEAGEISKLEEAVNLWQGAFIEGLSVKDSISFEEWVTLEREQLTRKIIRALHRLSDHYQGSNEIEKALIYAWRQIDLEPWCEDAHRRVMYLLAITGQRNAALTQYEALCRILMDELEVEPEAETTELYEQIHADALDVPIEGIMPVAPFYHLRPPVFLSEKAKPRTYEKPIFVARANELETLGEYLERALTDKGLVSFVVGEAGSGKTALLAEFSRRAQENYPKLLVVNGACDAYTGIGDPYLPFQDVLSMLGGDVEDQWNAGILIRDHALRLWRSMPITARALVEYGPALVDTLIPGKRLLSQVTAALPQDDHFQEEIKDLVERRSAIVSDFEQSSVFEQYTNVIRYISNERPILIILDDLQWADVASINLLFHLGRRLHGMRLLIIGAFRPEEVPIGIGEQSHPLGKVLVEFKRDFGETILDLDKIEGRDFVDSYLDIQPNQLGETFREALHHQTQGHSLFTVELVKHLSEQRSLIFDDKGFLVEGEAIDWQTLPPRVEGVIETRISRLDETLRAILSVASVEGEEFTTQVIAQVLDLEERHLLHHLSEDLEKTYRLIRAKGAKWVAGQHLSTYRFRHNLFQIYHYGILSEVERSHLHENVGVALEKLYGHQVEEVAIHLARHFELSGLIGKSIKFYQKAGERAREQFAQEEAIQHFKKTLKLLDTVSPDDLPDDQKLKIMMQVNEALGEVYLQRRDTEAKDTFQKVLSLMPEGDTVKLARLHRKIGNAWFNQMEHDKAENQYEMALKTLGKQPEAVQLQWWFEWIQLQHDRAYLNYFQHKWQKMDALFEDHQFAIEAHGTPAQRAEILNRISMRDMQRDRYKVSEETLLNTQTALVLAKESGNLQTITLSTFILGFALLWKGNLKRAEKNLQESLRLAQRLGLTQEQVLSLTYLTIIRRKQNLIEETRDFASCALELASTSEMSVYAGMANGNLAWVTWREGNLTKAKKHGRNALKMWGANLIPMSWMALWPLMAIAVAEGDTQQVIEYGKELIRPTQMRFPKPIEKNLERMIQAWDEKRLEEIDNLFKVTIESAKKLKFL